MSDDYIKATASAGDYVRFEEETLVVIQRSSDPSGLTALADGYDKKNGNRPWSVRSDRYPVDRRYGYNVSSIEGDLNDYLVKVNSES